MSFHCCHTMDAITSVQRTSYVLVQYSFIETLRHWECRLKRKTIVNNKWQFYYKICKKAWILYKATIHQIQWQLFPFLMHVTWLPFHRKRKYSELQNCFFFIWVPQMATFNYYFESLLSSAFGCICPIKFIFLSSWFKCQWGL